jgi:hypothetical protein
MGRPVKPLDPEKSEEVLALFPKDGTRVKWKVLDKEARGKGMSSRTLSKYMKVLEKARKIVREAKLSERPAGIYYRRVDEVDAFWPLREDYPLQKGYPPIFKEAIDKMVKELQDLKGGEDRERGQTYLLIMTGGLFLVRFWDALTQYSDFVEKEDAEEYLNIFIYSDLIPMIWQIARLTPPEWGRCKYPVFEAKDILLKTWEEHMERYYKLLHKKEG